MAHGSTSVESEVMMYVEFHGFPCRVKWLDKTERLRSLEVEINVHPLHLPRQMITGLHHLCNGRECWVHIGHTAPGENGDHCFIVYGQFFESRVPYIGHRDTLNEACEAMVGAVKTVFDRIESPPAALKGVSHES